MPHLFGARWMRNSEEFLRLMRESPPYQKRNNPHMALSWEDREKNRFTMGKYKPVPWAAEPWTAEYAKHYVHVSEKDPYMLAYTPSAEDGERDRRVPIKPGRYLQKFYSARLTAEQIKHWAGQVRGNGLQIMLTDNIEQIRKIYAKGGLTACMSHDVGHYQACHYNGAKHPLEAYLGGDIRLAYGISPEGVTIGRALVWPERKIYSRAYGDHEAFKRALEADGYRSGVFDGAQLKVIPLNPAKYPIQKRDGKEIPYLTGPYVDHVKWAKYDPVTKEFRLSVRATDATHSVQHGDGIAYPIPVAPPRPAGGSGETILAEWTRLCAIESGKAPEETKASKAEAGGIGEPNRAIWEQVPAQGWPRFNYAQYEQQAVAVFGEIDQAAQQAYHETVNRLLRGGQ